MPSTSGTGLCLKAMNVRTSRTKRRSMSARRGSVPPPAAKSATPAPGNDRNRKRTTINDIARMAAVSKKTVSRVINKSPYVREATRVKVKAIIAKTGFAPDPQARGLAFRRAFLLGLLYDNSNAQYIVDIQQGVLDCARRNTSCRSSLQPEQRVVLGRRAIVCRAAEAGRRASHSAGVGKRRPGSALDRRRLPLGAYCFYAARQAGTNDRVARSNGGG